MCRLEFRFQNLPFSKSAGKNVPFSCEREAYLSNFSPFSKCAGIVWTQSKLAFDWYINIFVLNIGNA